MSQPIAWLLLAACLVAHGLAIWQVVVGVRERRNPGPVAHVRPR